MRITENQLRRIIREEIEKDIDEAHAGSLGFAYEKPEYQVPDSDEPEPEDEEAFQGYVKDRARGAQRYARSGRFKRLAEKHYSNLPFAVWTAPYVGKIEGISTEVSSFRKCYRMSIMDLEYDGKSLLRKLGYAADGVGKDDLVILYATGVAISSVLATPWMVIHSIFDSAECANLISPGYSGIESVLMTGRGDPVAEKHLKPIAGDYKAEWQAYLTMKSARDNRINASNDALAEMVCQELLTRGGLRFDFGDLDEGDPTRKALTWLGQQVKFIAGDFKKKMRGKLIAIAVNQGDL